MTKLSNQIIFGIIILLVGILFLISNLGIYDTGNLLLYIPSLFVVLGIYSLIKSRFQNISGPLTMIIIFGVIQLLVLNIISWSDIASWWPLIIIFIGLGIIYNHYRKSSPKIEQQDKIDLIAILGGVDNTIKSPEFKGGDITALLGGVDVDLRDSKVGDQPAVINATAILGGVDIKIPENWEVKMQIIPILGGVDDERKRRDIEAEKSKPDLIIQGFVALGGVSITD